jgi:putative SOS response-associated peptidase YedK
MCGRFTLTASGDVLARVFGLASPPAVTPRYNIAPTQPVPIVRAGSDGARSWSEVHWGLIPSWADDPALGARLINARSETAAEKPSFRAAFRGRRCLVPASGFFEWKTGKGRKQPYYVRRTDERPLAFAGLWERWQPAADVDPVESCTILTCGPNALLAPLHPRMPVILAPEDQARWLAPDERDPARLRPLLRPCDPAVLEVYPVSTVVNNARRDGPECVEPRPEPREPDGARASQPPLPLPPAEPPPGSAE